MLFSKLVRFTFSGIIYTFFYMSAQPRMLIKFYKQRKCGADSFISEEALTKPKYK